MTQYLYIFLPGILFQDDKFGCPFDSHHQHYGSWFWRRTYCDKNCKHYMHNQHQTLDNKPDKVNIEWKIITFPGRLQQAQLCNLQVWWLQLALDLFFAQSKRVGSLLVQSIFFGMPGKIFKQSIRWDPYLHYKFYLLILIYQVSIYTLFTSPFFHNQPSLSGGAS